MRVYEVYFTETDITELPVVYFGFECKSSARRSDYRIELTIRDIFMDFNARCNAPVFFACSSSARSAKARFRLFGKWFGKHGAGFEKHDYCTGDFYSALIVPCNYPDREAVVKLFDDYLGGQE